MNHSGKVKNIFEKSGKKIGYCKNAFYSYWFKTDVPIDGIVGVFKRENRG